MFQEIKTLLKHSSIYGLGNVLSKAIGFLLIPLYTRYLTPADYGILEMLDVSMSILGMLITMGIGAAIFRYYHEYNDNKSRIEVISTAFWFIFVINTVFIALCITQSEFISDLIFNNKEFGVYVRLIFISFYFATLAVVPETYVWAMKRSGLYTTVSLCTLIGNILFTIYFVVILKEGVEGILYASIIMRFLNCCYWLFVTVPKIGFNFNKHKLRPMLKYGIPLIPGNFSQFIISMSGRYFMTRFTSMINVGLFSLGFKFAHMIGFLLLQPFERIWQSEMFEVEKKSEAKELYSRIFTYLIFVTTFCAMSISILMPEVLNIMADSSYKDANKVVPILTGAYVARSIYLYFHLGLYLKKKTKYTAFVSGTTGIITIILNLLLIRNYAEKGAACVILIAYTIMAIGLYLYSQNLYRIKVERRILVLFLSAILYYLVLGNLFIDNLTITIMVKVTALITYPLLLTIVNFYHLEEIDKVKNIAIMTYTNIFKNNK